MTPMDNSEEECKIDKNTVTHYDFDGNFKPFDTAREAFKRLPYYLEAFDVRKYKEIADVYIDDKATQTQYLDEFKDWEIC